MATDTVASPSSPIPASASGADRTPTPSLETRFEVFSIDDLASIRNLLRGGSVIDWHRLYFRDRTEVDRFLRVNELDPESAEDMARLDDLRGQAVEYLERHLAFRIPDE